MLKILKIRYIRIYLLKGFQYILYLKIIDLEFLFILSKTKKSRNNLIIPNI
jgi:hypothetical protein